MKKYQSLLTSIALLVPAGLLPLMGAIPFRTMDRIADWAQSFFAVSEEEEVLYFSMESLKGAGISILIGSALYLFVVRPFLSKKDRLPKWMDLENVLYRPVLLGILPWILGVACRVLDCFVDTLVVFLRKTVYRERHIPGELLEGNRFTLSVGRFLNAINDFANRTWRRNHPVKKDYVHSLAIASENVNGTIDLVSKSLSYGLLLFGVGLFVTIGYLLFYAYL